MSADPAGLPQFQELLNKFISLSVGFAFVALLIMLIIGGVKFIISGGEPKHLSEAQKTLTYALIGMIMLIVAWLILQLIHAFTGVDVTKFCIGFPPYCVLN